MKIASAAFYLISILPVFAQAPSGPAVAAAMGFEDPMAWVTAPFEFIDGLKSDFDNLATVQQRFDWVIPAQHPADLIHGAKLTTQVVKEGKSSLEWKDHGKFPTISCRTIDHDWQSHSGILLWMGSRVATGDTIVMGIQSDSPETPFLDYLTYEITVNWSGWRELRLPLADFTIKIGNPVGWKKVDAISFFAKVNGRNPDPRTVLYLDACKLVSGSVPDIPKGQVAPAPFPPGHPEVERQLEHDEALVQTCYFNAARARYGYNPHYTPGYVSFDPVGRAYLRGIAAIETPNAQGKWLRIDLKKVMEGYANENGWGGIRFEMPEDPAIRFDAQGDLYALEYVAQLDRAGKLQAKRTLLLHSSHKGGNWRIYPLPANKSADFEKLDGNNGDCLKYPPVITVKDFLFLPNRDSSAYLIVPEKQSDGSLQLPPVIRFGTGAVIGPVHSGGGNFILSQGDRVYAVYGVAYGASPPPIPPAHPAGSMTTAFSAGMLPSAKGTPVTGGIPTFVVAYNRTSRQLGAPVFVGYGGIAQDGHNWPAMTADSKGILHLVIGGHVNPLLYTHTMKPGDLTAWSPPVFVPFKTGEKTLALGTYASLHCDQHDNLLCVVRSDSYYYNHRLASLRKPADKPWGNERAIVIPFADGYHVWNHKVTYDKLRDRYFLAYYDQCNKLEMTRDAYLFYRFIWPSWEPRLTGQGKQAVIPHEGRKGMFDPGADEMTVLVSGNAGFSWQFATTQDFMAAK